MTLRSPGEYSRWDEQSGDFIFDREKWLNKAVRPLRDARLEAADRRVRRHDYQLRAGVATSETPEKIAEVLAYMQVLRDFPNGNLTPENLVWPNVP